MGEPSAKKSKSNTDEFPNVLADVADPVKAKLMELDSVQFEIDTISEKASDEILAIEQAYNKKKEPFYQKRKELIKAIPAFWHSAFLNHHLLSMALPEDQEDLIGKLVDIDVEEFEDIKAGYKIKLTFDDNNFFEAGTIVKSYHLTAENPTSTTSEIAWKPNKKPATQDVSDDQLTFVDWLATSLPPDGDEIAEVIKDDLYTNPLQYYVMADMNGETDEELEELLDEEDEIAKEK